MKFAIISMLFFLSPSSKVMANDSLHFGLGYIVATLERNTDQDEFAVTNKETTSVSISAFDARAMYGHVVNNSLQMLGGAELAILSSSSTLSQSNFVKKSLIIEPQYILWGGPHKFTEVDQIFSTEEQRGYRLLMPICFKYQSMDFDVPGTQGQQSFRGDSLIIEPGLRVDFDLFSNYFVGLGVYYQTTTVPLSHTAIKTSSAFTAMFIGTHL